MNIIAKLEFELVYYDSSVQHFNHHITGTPPFGWIIDLKDMSTCLELFYAKTLGNCALNTLIFTLFLLNFFWVFSHGIIFLSASLWHIYILTKAVQAVEGTYCAWLIVYWHTVHCFTPCDLITTQMNMQHSLIQQLMFYEFKFGHNAAKQSKTFVEQKGQ